MDAVLGGSVVRSGDRVRVTAQLIDAKDDRHLWAQSFEEPTGDLLALQDKIVREIASQTQTAIVRPNTSAASRHIDPAAHDAYLRGRYFFQKQDWPRSVAYFRQAIAIDPSYASAYAGLGDALEAESAFQTAPPGHLISRALAAAKRAIELDPGNGEVYTELGSIFTIYQWNWEAAERNLQRGIALAPDYPLAEMKYAAYLDAVGRPQEAVTHMRRALSLDPFSFFMTRRLGATLYLARNYDEALDQLRRADEMEPGMRGSVDGLMSLAYEEKGMHDQAVDHDIAALKANRPNLNLANLHSMCGTAGKRIAGHA